MDEKRYGRLVGLVVVLAFIGVAMSLFIVFSDARALDVEEVDRTTIAPPNPLVVMPASMLEEQVGASPGGIEVVSSGEGVVTRLDGAYGGDLPRQLQRARIDDYRLGLVESIADEWGRGLLVEFPDCDGPGDSAELAVRYPLVGTYADQPVGAEVVYRFHWAQMTRFDPDYTHIAVQLCDSLFGGVDMCNVSSVDVSLKLIDASSGEEVPFGPDAFVTLGSLNFFDPADSSSPGELEFVSTDIEVTSRIAVPARDGESKGNCEVVVANEVARVLPRTAGGWVDRINDETFYRNSASLYPSNGTVAFTVGRETVDGSTTNGAQTWWTLSSASITVPTPPDPVKTVDKPDVTIGETVRFAVAQTVHTAGVDIMTKYTSFVFTDQIPPETDIIEDSVRMYRIDASGKIDVTDSGEYAFDPVNRVLEYRFSSDALRAMPMQHEVYQLEFDARVTERAEVGRDVVNVATVRINEHEGNARATVAPYLPVPVKRSEPISGTVVVPGQTIGYEVSYTNDSDLPVDIELFDIVPENTSYVDDSVRPIDGSAAPDAISDSDDDPDSSRVVVRAVWENVEPGRTVGFLFDVTVDEKVADTVIVNTGFLRCDGGAVVLTNTVEHPVGEVVLNLVKDSDPRPGSVLPASGTVILYKLTIENGSDAAVGDIVIRDDIPRFTRFAYSEDMEYADGETPFVWVAVPELGAGESRTFTFAVEVDPLAETGSRTVSNQACWQLSGQTDPDLKTDEGWMSSNVVEHTQTLESETGGFVHGFGKTGRLALPWALGIAAAAVFAGSLLLVFGKPRG